MPVEVEARVGRADAVAQWFITPNDVSEAHQDEEREEILRQVSKFTEYGVHGKSVVLRVPKGRVMITVDGDLVWFSYVPKGRWELLKFWMSRSSMKEMGVQLRSQPMKMVAFSNIFFKW